MKTPRKTRAGRGRRSVQRIVSRRWRDKKCVLCNGRGLVPVTIIDVTADFECPNCDGTGNDGRWESANAQAHP